jgi:asparagine synthase (glutamine-hydrolysing)
LTTICACVSREPTDVDSHLREIIRRADPDDHATVRGFIEGSPFSTFAGELSIPGKPGRWGAAAIAPEIGGDGFLVDPPTLSRPRVESLLSFLEDFDGKASPCPFFGAAIVPRGRNAVIARDPIGSRPLYFSEGNPTLYSSQPRLLPARRPIQPFPSSTVLDLSTGVQTELAMPALASDSRGKPRWREGNLIRVLSGAIEAIRPPRLVFFSGGIDSLVIAKIASNMGETILVTAGLEGSRDLSRARAAAESLPADFVPVIIPKNEIPEDVRILRAILSTDSPLSIGISLPLYRAALRASEMGLKRGLAGQGADELFGGYHRYISDPDPAATMERDLVDLHSRGLDAFNLAAEAAGIQIFMPYLDQVLVLLARSAPIEEKVRGGGRKILLQKVGRSLGLEPSQVTAKKLAIQYGSGVNPEVLKVLRGKC